VNWGAWTEIGAAVDRGLVERLASQGLGTLTPKEGLSALQRLVDTGVPQALVFPVDWKRFLEKFAPGGTPPPFLSEIGGGLTSESQRTLTSANASHAAPQVDDLRKKLLEAPESRRNALVTAFVRDHAGRALGLSSSMVLDPRTPLADLGLDSLLAVELRNSLGGALGTALPATLLFDYPSVAALADHIAGLLQPQLEEPPQAAAETGTAEESLLDRVESLSDEELDRLLTAKMQGN
jgi:acyl carrier protein